jgi:hypothetical protein
MNMRTQVPKPVAYATHTVWMTLPATITLMKQHRNSGAKASTMLQAQFLNTGVNASIILLSATCIEGFLVECLQSFATDIHFENDQLQKEILTAMFPDFPRLFEQVLGKPLGDLIENDIHKGSRMLVNFRNGLAHCRSASYWGYNVPSSTERKFMLGGQYEEIYAYVKSHGLLDTQGLKGVEAIVGTESLFTNKIADHFSNLVKPYMDEVLKQLPPPQTDSMGLMVTMAFGT